MYYEMYLRYVLLQWILKKIRIPTCSMWIDIWIFSTSELTHCHFFAFRLTESTSTDSVTISNYENSAKYVISAEAPKNTKITATVSLYLYGCGPGQWPVIVLTTLVAAIFNAQR